MVQKLCKLVTLGVFLTIAAIATTGCTPETLLAVESPAGTRTAVLKRSNFGGATTGFSYDVYVKEKGRIRSERVWSSYRLLPQIEWRSEGELVITAVAGPEDEDYLEMIETSQAKGVVVRKEIIER